MKTPLAVITNEAREDKGPLGEKIIEQAGIMRDQVNHYLDRARVAARVGLGRATPVLPVLEPLVRALERIHRDRGIKISIDCQEGLRFAGERQDLEEMLGNVADNACKWAKGGVVHHRPPRATGKADQRPPSGPHFPHGRRRRPRPLARAVRQNRQARVRLDETKPGSGLGLSIVTELVQSYHGASTSPGPKKAASGSGSSCLQFN